jgi:RNA polymerase sigma-70 factor (ECF subfamily)
MLINLAARRIGTVIPFPWFLSKGRVMMMTLRRERPPAAAPTAPGRETEQSFDAAFVALLPMVRAFARPLAKSNADDIAQGTILRAWAARSSYTPGTNLKAWLRTILHNHVYSEARRNGRTEAMAHDIIENILVSHDDPASREVLDAVRLLPEDEHEILMLAGPGGLTCQEMAARFACAVGAVCAVKSRLSRARASLAHRLAVVKKPAGRKLQTRYAVAGRTRPLERRGSEPDSPAGTGSRDDQRSCYRRKAGPGLETANGGCVRASVRAEEKGGGNAGWIVHDVSHDPVSSSSSPSRTLRSYSRTLR